jgi:hypothetical protein
VTVYRNIPLTTSITELRLLLAEGWDLVRWDGTYTLSKTFKE